MIIKNSSLAESAIDQMWSHGEEMIEEFEAELEKPQSIVAGAALRLVSLEIRVRQDRRKRENL